MKDNGKNRCEVLFRTIPPKGNSSGVNVYKRIDNRFYIYKTIDRTDFTEEEYVGRCMDEETLDIYINSILKSNN